MDVVEAQSRKIAPFEHYLPGTVCLQRQTVSRGASFSMSLNVCACLQRRWYKRTFFPQSRTTGIFWSVTGVAATLPVLNVKLVPMHGMLNRSILIASGHIYKFHVVRSSTIANHLAGVQGFAWTFMEWL